MPQYDKRLMVNIVDETAQSNPDQEWVSVPRSSDPKDGWNPITFKQAANAINRVAHKLVATSGQPKKNEFPTVAFIAHNDVRYIVFALGAVKAGYQALFISPRNPQEAQLNLFELTNCHTIWFDASFKSTVQAWLQERDMHAIMTFPVDAWFPKEQIEPFPYTKTFEEAEWDPMLLLHTSGSTGFPKPIVVRQGMLAIGDKFRTLPDKNGRCMWLEELRRRCTRIFHPSEMD
jgi:acyl-CoA synthetase (AMP-forming)/AMP-acid ligase II